LIDPTSCTARWKTYAFFRFHAYMLLVMDLEWMTLLVGNGWIRAAEWWKNSQRGDTPPFTTRLKILVASNESLQALMKCSEWKKKPSY
jgi:hypothetical protein